MASISVEALIGILFLIMVISIFYASLSAVTSNFKDLLQQKGLEQRATSTALLTTVYSYSLSHGSFNAELSCPVGESVVCKDDGGRIAVAQAYKRTGGGD